MEKQKRKSKSKAKIAGVKSTFIVGQDLLMTSFGTRDEARLEKQVSNGIIKNLQTEEAYSVKQATPKLAVKKTGNNIQAKIDNPLAEHKKCSSERAAFSQRVKEHNEIIKKRYEELVFGRAYDDNIHIQVISKILDIEKTFSYTMGNIVYAINNMNSDFGNDNFDDYMMQVVREDEEKLNKILPRCLYAFDLSSWDRKSKNISENIITLKVLLYYINLIRNDSFHGINSNSKKVSIPSKKYNLTDIQSMFSSDSAEQKTLYSFNSCLYHKWQQVNENYQENSKVNINFLCYVLYGNNCTEKQKQELAKNYFDFAILKKYKNIGFSLTSLREQLFALYGLNFEEKNNLRSRMNSFCDYVLFDYYEKGFNTAALVLVDNLRCSADEKEKETVYKEEAYRISNGLKQKFNRIASFEVDSIEAFSTAPCNYELEYNLFVIDNHRLSENAQRFCNMVYFLTQFLDGKEINIFLTSLHNIFENIASFLDVMKKSNIPCNFSEKYAMFEESEYIAICLEKVISLSRMKKTLDYYNHQTLCDAISVVGKSKIHADLSIKEYIDSYLYGENGHSLRNFLVANVISSRKFNYIARYCNLSTVSDFAKNKVLVEYVLRRIDPKQIDRYCASTHIDCCNFTYDDKINNLVKIVSSINIDKFERINNSETKENGTANNSTIRERDNARACVGLYLNVLYQIVKNLMYVNGRYALAFAMTERDMLIEELIQSDKKKKENKVEIDYILLTDKYLNEDLLKRATEEIRENIKKYGGNIETLEHIPGEYIRKNRDGYCQGSTNTFRNAVAHMTMMALAPKYVEDISKVTSYFALYHYCMQKHIMYCSVKHDKTTCSNKLSAAFESAKQHHSYSKDAVKYLCLPFAYNVPRFKALTIEGLFDWSEYGNNDK